MTCIEDARVWSSPYQGHLHHKSKLNHHLKLSLGPRSHKCDSPCWDRTRSTSHLSTPCRSWSSPPKPPYIWGPCKDFKFLPFLARLTSQRRSCSAGHSCIPWGKISSPSLVSTDRFSSLNSQSRPEPLWKNGTLTPARRLLSCGKWEFYYCRVGLNSCFQWESVQ